MLCHRQKTGAKCKGGNCVGFLVGALTGLLTGAGVGGGTLLLLYLTQVGNMPQIQAQGTNLLYFLAAALPALWGHIKHRRVEVKGGIIAGLCGGATCLLGVWLAGLLPPQGLQKAMGGLLVLVGIKELLAKETPQAKGEGGRDARPLSK